MQDPRPDWPGAAGQRAGDGSSGQELPGLSSTGGDVKGGAEMFVVQATPQAVESARTIILLFAAISVIFWKTLIKLAVTVAAIVLVVLLTAGAIMIFQNVHHLAK
jgi:hypothetical protein